MSAYLAAAYSLGAGGHESGSIAEQEDPLSACPIRFLNYDHRLPFGVATSPVPGAVVGLLEQNTSASDESSIIAHESSCLHHHELIRSAEFRQPPVIIMSNGGWLRQGVRVLYAVDTGHQHPDTLRLYMAVHYVPNDEGTIEAHWVRAVQPMIIELAQQLLIEKGLDLGYVEQEAIGVSRSNIIKIAPKI